MFENETSKKYIIVSPVTPLYPLTAQDRFYAQIISDLKIKMHSLK